MNEKEHEEELEQEELQEVVGGMKTAAYNGEIGTASKRNMPPAEPDPKIEGWRAERILEMPRRMPK